eukprot:g6583.t1
MCKPATCGSGAFAPRGSVSADQCELCPAGKYRSVLQSPPMRVCAPTACEMGAFSLEGAVSRSGSCVTSCAKKLANSVRAPDSDNCICAPGYFFEGPYWVNGERSPSLECLPLPAEGVACVVVRRNVSSAMNCTPRDFVLAEGVWRTGSDSSDIRACPVEGTCLPNGRCAEGHSGPLCILCKDGWAQQFDLGCSKCGSGEHAAFAIVTAIVGGLFALMLVCLWFESTMFQRLKDCGRDAIKVVRNAITMLKILLTFMQITHQMLDVYSIPFPPMFVKFARALAFVTLDLVRMFFIGCVYTWDYFHSLLFSTLCPLFLGLSLLSLWQLLVHKSIQQARGERLQTATPNKTERVAVICQWSIFLTLFAGLLFKVGVTSANTDGSSLGWLITLCNVIVIVIAIVETLRGALQEMRMRDESGRKTPDAGSAEVRNPLCVLTRPANASAI